jgi:hypothetical protein
MPEASIVGDTVETGKGSAGSDDLALCPGEHGAAKPLASMCAAHA